MPRKAVPRYPQVGTNLECHSCDCTDRNRLSRCICALPSSIARFPLLASRFCLPHSMAMRPRRLCGVFRRPGVCDGGGSFAAGAVASLALALTFALDKGWLTVGLALMVPGIAWISEQRPLPALRYLSAALIVLVLLRVGYEPRIVGATSAPHLSSIGCSMATEYPLPLSGTPAICCGDAPTTCQLAWRIWRRSCSRCCSRFCKSATT